MITIFECDYCGRDILSGAEHVIDCDYETGITVAVCEVCYDEWLLAHPGME